MKNSIKIFVCIGVVIIVGIIVAVIIYKVNSTKTIVDDTEYDDIYLEGVNVEAQITDRSSRIVNNNVSVIDEQNGKINTSSVLSEEKFLFDNKIGIYGFEINYDFDQSELTFVIKNHSNETVKGFDYRLLLLNKDGSIYGNIDLNSKDIPALSKYKVTVKVKNDISDIYDIVPTNDFNVYGKNVGGNINEEV